MDEGRLAAVKKSRDYNRKMVYVMNDIIKNRQEMYESCLRSEMQESRSRIMSELVATRRTMVRNKILLQCLDAGKKCTGPNSLSPYGAYGGRPIGAFSRDIDRTIAWNHPKLRRLRKVEKMKESCLKHGAILDQMTVRQRMDSLFTKSVDRSEYIAQLSQNARQSQQQMTEDKLKSVHGKKSDFLRGRSHQHFPPSQLPDLDDASGVTLKLNSHGRLKGIGRKEKTSHQDLNRLSTAALETLDEVHEDEKTKHHHDLNLELARDLEHKEATETETREHADDFNLRLGPHLALLPPIPATKISESDKSSSQDNAKQNNSNVSPPDKTRNAKTRRKSEKADGINNDIKLKFTSSKPNDEAFLNPKSKDTPKAELNQQRHSSKLNDGYVHNESLSYVSESADSVDFVHQKGYSKSAIDEEVSPLKRAPTLVLPPIQSKKSDVEAKRS